MPKMSDFPIYHLPNTKPSLDLQFLADKSQSHCFYLPLAFFIPTSSDYDANKIPSGLVTKQFIFKGQTPQQFLCNQNTTKLIHKNIYALLQQSMEKDFKFYSSSVRADSQVCKPPSSTRDILNSTDDALTLKLVEPYIIGADQEILVCNLLDEVFSSVKHLLLVTKIFHSYQAMAVSQVLEKDIYPWIYKHMPTC